MNVLLDDVAGCRGTMSAEDHLVIAGGFGIDTNVHLQLVTQSGGA